MYILLTPIILSLCATWISSHVDTVLATSGSWLFRSSERRTQRDKKDFKDKKNNTGLGLAAAQREASLPGRTTHTMLALTESSREARQQVTSHTETIYWDLKTDSKREARQQDLHTDSKLNWYTCTPWAPCMFELGFHRPYSVSGCVPTNTPCKNLQPGQVKTCLIDS